MLVPLNNHVHHVNNPERFFFNDPATTEIYTLSLHDALPICRCVPRLDCQDEEQAPWSLGWSCALSVQRSRNRRSEEHTSELQSHSDLVCRLLLEKKKLPGEAGGRADERDARRKSNGYEPHSD